MDAVNIKLVEVEIHDLKSRFNNIEMKVDANICEAFYDANLTSLQQLHFQITDHCGSVTKLEHEITGLTSKF